VANITTRSLINTAQPLRRSLTRSTKQPLSPRAKATSDRHRQPRTFYLATTPQIASSPQQTRPHESLRSSTTIDFSPRRSKGSLTVISDMAAPRPRMHARSPTFPLYHSTRKKPRRWPLVLRFIKGAIHVDIAMPVVLHAAWAALIVYIDQVREDHIGLPSSIIPSLSIVVGLMLVFRNSTSYDRFWQVCHP
jgi:hypothetical protein